MSSRIKQMLELLQDSQSFITVATLAQTIGVSERTLFRDIVKLEDYLKIYDVGLVKQRGVGVKLTGDISRLNERFFVRQNYFLRLNGEERCQSIIVYLAMRVHIIKIVELSQLYGVSDSCISNDLKKIDNLFLEEKKDIRIIRQKGVGITLAGDEWTIRMYALRCFFKFVNPKDVLGFLFQRQENELVKEIIRYFGFDFDSQKIVVAIESTEKQIGYTFSWFDLLLLYMYLQLALKRRVIFYDSNKLHFPKFVQNVAMEIAENLWTLFAQSDRYEIAWLQTVLSAMEPGEHIKIPEIYPQLPSLFGDMFLELAQKGYRSIEPDTHVYTVLKNGLSFLLYKRSIQMPTLTSTSSTIKKKKDSYSADVCLILKQLINQYTQLDITEDELSFVAIALRPFLEKTDRKEQHLRIVVACFEGICLAQGIAALIKKTFPNVLVESALSSERLNDSWLVEHKIDLVVTTFPTGFSSAPEFIIDLPFNIADFIQTFTKCLHSFEKYNEEDFWIDTLKENIDFYTDIDSVILLLHTFALKEFPKSIATHDYTKLIAQEISSEKHIAQKLKRDLDKREMYGAVYLDDSKVRLFHCRTKYVSNPVIGILRFRDTKTVLFYMLASENATSDQLKIISKISIALIGDTSFTEALASKSLSEIKKNLYRILAPE
ncbi:MAG TPA: hypothetical protein DDW88_00490 [Treponema sp.]|nr:hypothetical protein [Treponema sp.]